MYVLVTGGTGTLGKQVLPRLAAAGAKIRVLSRTAKPGADRVACDLTTGEGLAEAMRGIDTVLHLAGGQKGDDVAAANLVRAAEEAGVGHIVHISVIGADTMPISWFKMKLAAEDAIRDSKIPHTILRAAQFHDLVFTIAEKMTKMPLVPAPGGLRFQPVASEDVAARLVELTVGEPQGLVDDIAGPRVYDMRELLRGFLAARGKKRPLLPVRMPGKVGRAYRAGDNLSLERVRTGAGTWEDFLAARLG
ncbi:NmrA family transcriptional regulator [Actinorhabdospora filicis]|uniref:NmrA family transcriptional regulator n=1 Tax=Actinorhabdospora filicis TaxID=1785913 RepID=A0A9W6SRJ9_9ACTN|nr:NAD(P)H-binding protein [Actinorhabdospora filicis]GLZ80788.1 NmrA family transcriptional regulator [Actinorhabdospora filicis]